MSFQEITVIGNVGRIDELRFTPNGNKVVNATIAVNGHNDVTTWYKLTFWNKLAETVSDHVTKGDKLFVKGRPSVEAWNDKDGNPQATMVITGDTVRFLSPKGDEA